MRSIAGGSMMIPGPGMGGRSFFHFSVETARGMEGSEFPVPSSGSDSLSLGTVGAIAASDIAELGTRNSELRYTSDPPNSACCRRYCSRLLAKPGLHRVEDGVCNFPFVCEGNGLASTILVQDRDPVGVPFEPRSRLEGVVDDDEVEILPPQLFRPLSVGIAGLERKSNDHRLWAPERNGTAQDILGRLQLDGEFPGRARPFVVSGILRTIVGRRCGHDQHIGRRQFFPHHSVELCG